MGIKTYIEYINYFIKENNLKIAENILLKCLNVCENNIDNTFFQIYGDVVFSKYLNILCLNKKYEEAIKIIENYIKINLKKEKEDFYQINKMYIMFTKCSNVLYKKE
jgi:tetratricopeptide (TPR) repeat protein